MTGFVEEATIHNLSVEIGNLTFNLGELRLFPNIKFNTNGYITAWTVGGIITKRKRNPELQIWRKINDSNDDDYIRVNKFQLDEMNGIVIASNVREYSVNPPVQVQAGDILGLFQPNDSSVFIYYQECHGPLSIGIPVAKGSESPATLNEENFSSEFLNDYPLIAVNFSSKENEVALNSSCETSFRKKLSSSTFNKSSRMFSTIAPSVERSLTTFKEILSTSTVENHEWTVSEMSTLAISFESNITDTSSKYNLTYMYLIGIIVGGTSLLVAVLCFINAFIFCLLKKTKTHKRKDVASDGKSSIITTLHQHPLRRYGILNNSTHDQEPMQYNPLYYYYYHSVQNGQQFVEASPYLEPISTLRFYN